MSDWHVTPINDFRDHDTKPSCWCRPEEVEPGLWSHNAMDGRELVETGKRAVQ